MSNTSFSVLALKPGLLANLESLGYQFMTPIQAMSLPLILEGKDIVGQAKTGSGKTAAFGLGLLQNLDVAKFRVQTLVLCPTRELADQVAKEIRNLARQIHNIKVLSLYGGVAFGPQKGSLEHGAHIIVGTPGRIEEHLRKRNLDLSNLNTLVLDEADRMLDMGFAPVIEDILKYVPERRQTMLFSATFPREIDSLSRRIMQQPARVEIDATHDTDTIAQYLYRIDGDTDRAKALQVLLLHYQPASALVFCNTRQLTDEVSGDLRAAGFSALSIHGDLDQKDRDSRLVRFANKSTSVLVATDVAARGLDIDKLDMVINYHLSRDPEVHTHRVGRTGRAGDAGIACSLFQEKESGKIEILEAVFGQTLERLPLPDISPDSRPVKPQMVTLQIEGGRKQKVRPGDILGALTSGDDIKGAEVGKITVFDQSVYVAVNRRIVKKAYQRLSEGRIKGRSFRVRYVE